MKTSRFIMGAVAAFACAAGGWADPGAAAAASPWTDPATAPAPKPLVEAVFVLDSTGSMGGLIEGAKLKIWAIANSIVGMKPTPEVRIGLLSYRDQGDEYVTRSFDLTADIDSVFANLQSFSADGGGDDRESVNQALYEAVHGMSWTTGLRVLKMVFLVGDYPPHMDYKEVQYPATCRFAAANGIIINTVQCGTVESTTQIWKEIARLAEGSSVALEQSGGMVSVITPFDDDIARISAELAGTAVVYGAMELQQGSRSKMAAAAEAPAPLAADRAAYNLASGGKAIQGFGDLVADVKDGAIDLSRLPADQLPPEMRKMSQSERSVYVAAQQKRRDELNQDLAALVEKRARYIAAEQEKRASSGAGDSFDAKVAEIIASQAARMR